MLDAYPTPAHVARGMGCTARGSSMTLGLGSVCSAWLYFGLGARNEHAEAAQARFYALEP